jgi:hypothetical protein
MGSMCDDVTRAATRIRGAKLVLLIVQTSPAVSELTEVISQCFAVCTVQYKPTKGCELLKLSTKLHMKPGAAINGWQDTYPLCRKCCSMRTLHIAASLKSGAEAS